MPISAAAAAGAPRGAVVPIASVTTTGPTNTTFTNIPSIYQDLYIRVSSNTQQAGSASDYLYMSFNGSVGTNYSVTRLNGNGLTLINDRTSNDAGIYPGIRPAFASNLYGGMTIHVLNYANTFAFKNVLTVASSTENVSSGYTQLTSGTWRSTSAITSILFGGTGNYPGSGTTYTLYGVRSSGQ
jgi:hypothetical protein